jgi:addiction module RelB/DinJ family antitoxin
MSRVIRSAMLQMRVTPAIKFGSERVLRLLGLSMTKAIELFLRRMIVDQRIPFDVVALDPATLALLEDQWDKEERIAKKHDRPAHDKSRTRARPKRGQ